MPRRASSPPPLTWSAYPKKDVLHHLCRAIHAGDPETACYMSAEMVCTPTPSSLSELCGTLIDAYAGLQARLLHIHPLSFVVRVFARLERSLSPLLDVASSPPSTGRLHEVEAVQKGVCAVVVLLTQIVRSTYGSPAGPVLRRGSRAPHAWPSLSGTASSGRQATTKGREEALAIGRAFLPLELPPAALDALWSVFVLCSSPSARTEDLDARVVSLGERTRMAASPSGLPRLEGPTFARITSGLRANQRGDVLWYLWHMCASMAASDRRTRGVVLQALRLFKHRLSAASRAPRMSLLCLAYRAVAALVRGGAPGSEGSSCTAEDLGILDSYDRLMSRAQAGIHIVYSEILGRDDQDGTGSGDPAAREEPPPRRSNDPEDDGETHDSSASPALGLEEKLRFLWCYTLRDDGLRLAIEGEIQEMHERACQRDPHPCGMRRVCSSHIANATVPASRRLLVTKGSPEAPPPDGLRPCRAGHPGMLDGLRPKRRGVADELFEGIQRAHHHGTSR